MTAHSLGAHINDVGARADHTPGGTELAACPTTPLGSPAGIQTSHKHTPMSDTSPRVRTWVRGSDSEIRTGLLGYISVEVGGIVLDGITLRRTSTGRLSLSFPARRDRGGRQHPIIRPATDQIRRQVEDVILEQLAQHTEVAS